MCDCMESGEFITQESYKMEGFGKGKSSIVVEVA